MIEPAAMARAIDSFARRFNATPRFGAIAPGRVNLIGEHTDYNEGFVLPIAINRHAIIVASPTAAPFSTLCAVDWREELEVDLRVKQLAPRPRHWSNYLLGVAQQFIDRGHALPNLDLALTSTVPIGAGLSSSAAIEVAMATLLEHVTGVSLDPLDKALLCQRAEHAFAGVPCGIMDMLVATSAREGCALLIDCRSNQSQPVPMPSPDDVRLLIADTGVTRELASGEYADRRRTCETAAKKLGLGSLRDATVQMLASDVLTDVERRRASHVVTENTRTLLAAAALLHVDMDTLGALMFDSHQSLRELYQVSCAELDAVVDIAAQRRGASEGVIGARMTGGGFGGCAIVLCHADAALEIAQLLLRESARRFPCQLAIFTAAATGAALAFHPCPVPTAPER